MEIVRQNCLEDKGNSNIGRSRHSRFSSELNGVEKPMEIRENWQDTIIVTRSDNWSIGLMDIPEYMETERLCLRPYQSGDGPMFYAAGMRNRAHLAEFESGNILMHLKNEVQAEEIIENLVADWAVKKCFFIGIFEKGSGQWVGQVYVGPTNWDLPEFTIGFAADVNYEGNGYISEAVIAVLRMLFINMGAHRIKSDCHENNVRSWRLLERCGFRREGHLRENKRNADGSFHGDYLYGLLRREFEEHLAIG